MTVKVKIAFVLPEGMQRDLKEKIVRDGYDLKGKSLWVSEAIERLLKLHSYKDLVKLNDEMNGFGKMESVLVALSLKHQIDEAIIDIRKEYPALEGVQSRILRTAIVQRLVQS